MARKSAPIVERGKTEVGGSRTIVVTFPNAEYMGYSGGKVDKNYYLTLAEARILILQLTEVVEDLSTVA